MSKCRQQTIGWDIGGAYVKAVLLDTKGHVVAALQLPCPLWRGLDYLEQAIHQAMQHFVLQMNALHANIHAPYRASFLNVKHAITMTGELVDLFASRYDGVCQIAKLVNQLLGEDCFFYVANCHANPNTNRESNRESNSELMIDNEIKHGFVRAFDVPRFASLIASANWHASATFIGQQVPKALLIDIGSTTSDIIPIIDGKIILQGYSDAARLKDDTLVYTGVVRTPVMALAHKLPFFDSDKLVEMNVMAEFFATMGDVYRLTGELTMDDAETADGKGKSPIESARRLARMIGYDVHNNLEKWIALAFSCKALQMQQLSRAIKQHLTPNMMMIGTGAGSFLAKQIALDLHVSYKPAFDYAFRPAASQATALQSTAMGATGQVGLTLKQDIDVCFAAFAVGSLCIHSSHGLAIC